jgi:hypothetical protein
MPEAAKVVNRLSGTRFTSGRSAEAREFARGSSEVASHVLSRPIAVASFQAGGKMLWTITVILLVLWALGLVSGSAVGSWIHILLVLAIISLIFAVMRRGSAAV